MPARTHYPALDGLRGLAILLIVFYHNFSFTRYTSFGWVGVDLFFVLSGYLITGILVRSYGDDHYLRNFYIKRVLRIFPLYFSVLVLILFVLPLWIPSPALFSYPIEYQAWLWTFMQNWLYIVHPPDGSGILNHFWSLAVEEQFYLVWPFIILWLKKPRYLLFFILILLITLFGLRLFTWVQQIKGFPYYTLFSFSRIDGICIGSMIFLLQHIRPGFLRKNIPWILGCLVVLNLCFYYIRNHYDTSLPYLALLGYTTLAIVFGLLVHEATKGKQAWVRTIFSFNLLRFFGRISFGLYVFHWPMYVLLRPTLLEWTSSTGSDYGAFLCSLVISILAVLLSLLSYHFFEKRFTDLKEKLD